MSAVPSTLSDDGGVRATIAQRVSAAVLRPKTGWLWTELTLFFFVFPGALAGWRYAWRTNSLALQAEFGETLGKAAAGLDPTRLMFPGLYVLCGVALVLLLLDKSFDRKSLWNWGAAMKTLPKIFGVWLVLGAGLFGLAFFRLPGHAFANMLLERPVVLLVILFLYPLLSVYPQGLLYRNFFFHRYERILGRGTQALVLHTLAFGFMHLIFLNLVAPLICLGGGIVMGGTYLRTRSAAAAGIEHSLYGLTLFACGIGEWYFFGGSYGGVAG